MIRGNDFLFNSFEFDNVMHFLLFSLLFCSIELFLLSEAVNKVLIINKCILFRVSLYCETCLR